MPLPTIIILDGCSGAGKSSISRALQEALLPDLWLSYSMDTILDILPASVLDRCNKLNDWSGVDPSVFAGGVACLRALADTGNRVIFDTTLSTKELASQLLEALGSHSYVSVAVVCAWEELERRTLARGDRTLEEVRRGFEAAPKQLQYDIVLDTTTLPPDAAARQIADRLAGLASA